MVTDALVRPARTWRLLLAFALLPVLVAPAHAPLLQHVRPLVEEGCGGASAPC